MDLPTYTVNKPQTDGRSYQYLKLSNGLRVLVASDPDTSASAAAALTVLAGSVHEPKEIPGLAHFCEHMVLHGTVEYAVGKYDRFADFLKQHGGTHNGVTTMQQTCFAFEIQGEQLEGALSRFARFFIAPTFSYAHQHQEIQAIDSEHSMNVQNDFRRQWAILLLDANPRHQYHWGSGCSKTLIQGTRAKSMDLHRAMESFHATAYKAQRMALTVISSQSTEVLASWVRKHFESIPSAVGNLGESLDMQSTDALVGDSVSGDEPPFLAQDFCGEIFVVPLKDVRQFRLAWLLPWQVAKWRSKPTAYASYLLCQEGRGSLLASLKSRGLAHGLSVSCFDFHGVASTFELTIDLDHNSMDDAALQEVGELVFAYISLLRSLGPQHWVLQELVQRYALDFAFRCDSRAYELAQDLACNLHYYPVEEVLAADHLLYDADSNASMDILGLMTVQNARLWLISRAFQGRCTSTEPWYGGRFLKHRCINHSRRTRWQAVETSDWKAISQRHGFSLPVPNRFLPCDLSLRSVPQRAGTAPPIELLSLQDPWCRAWLRQSMALRQPKVAASFFFHCSFVARGCEETALALMLCNCVQEELKAECAFEARMAGAMYRLELADTGFLLQLLGFRDKLPVLAAAVARKLIDFREVPEVTWAQVKDEQSRLLDDAVNRGQAYNQALGVLEELLQQQRAPAAELQKALAALQRTQLTNVANELFGPGCCLVEALVTGNVLETEASGLLEAVLKPLRLRHATCRHSSRYSLPPHAVPARAEMLLPRLPALTILSLDGRNGEDTNSCALESICNIAQATPENEAMAAVLMRVLKPMFFNELRTKQQLGYVVSSFLRTRATHISLIFLVQTEKAAEVARRSIHRFLQEAFQHVLHDLSEHELRQHCEGLAKQLEEEPRNLWEALQRDWLPIEERTFAFASRRRQVVCLRGCSLNGLRAFVLEQVQSAPRLAVLLRSPKTAWHRVTPDAAESCARCLTRWAIKDYKKELIASKPNTSFGKVTLPWSQRPPRQDEGSAAADMPPTVPSQPSIDGKDEKADQETEEGVDEEDEEEEEECKVQ